MPRDVMLQTVRDALSIFKKNIKYILLLMLCISLPLAVIQVVMIQGNFDVNGAMQTIVDASERYAADPNVVDEEAVQAVMSKITLYLGLLLFMSSLSALADAGVMYIYKYRSEGREIHFRDIFEDALRIFPKLWITSILADMSIAMGLLFCVLPGIILYFLFYFTKYMVVITSLWGNKAIFMSSLVTRKYRNTTIILLVAGVAYTLLVNVVVSLASMLIPSISGVGETISIIVMLISTLLGLVYTAVVMHFALNMKVDFDPELLKKPRSGAPAA